MIAAIDRPAFDPRSAIGHCAPGISLTVSGSFEWATKSAERSSTTNAGVNFIVYMVGRSPFDYRFSRVSWAGASIPYSVRFVSAWRHGECFKDYSTADDRNRLPAPLAFVEVPWERNATSIQIKAAFREWVKSAHPDKGGDPEVFISVHAEYERFMAACELAVAGIEI